MERVDKKNFRSMCVFVFGQNSYGELGLGDIEDRLEPTQLPISEEIEVEQIAAGNEFSAILTTNGALLTFGFNGSGQLGLGTTASASSPTAISFPYKEEKIASIVASNGCEHLIILSESGKVYSTGFNNYGQLGINSQINTFLPALVTELKDYAVSSAACSYYHSIFIATSTLPGPSKVTKVFTCGRNENGQLGFPKEVLSVVPRVIPELTGKCIVKASCGLHHSIFLSADGKLFSCGNNENGQLGFKEGKSRFTPGIVEDLKDYFCTSVSCGYYHTLALTDKGDVFAFGKNDKGQLGIVTDQVSTAKAKQIKDFQMFDDILNITILNYYLLYIITSYYSQQGIL